MFFLHYHSEAEAQEKWERRCKRINWNRLLVKFNDQNGANLQETLDAFLKIPYNKLFFTCKKWCGMTSDCFIISQPSCYTTITASHEPFGKSRYVDQHRNINDFLVMCNKKLFCSGRICIVLIKACAFIHYKSFVGSGGLY